MRRTLPRDEKGVDISLRRDLHWEQGSGHVAVQGMWSSTMERLEGMLWPSYCGFVLDDLISLEKIIS